MLQIVRRMTSVLEVFAFMKLSEVEPRIGQALEELSIDLAHPVFAHPRSLFVYCRAMRNALRLSPNVTDLTLLIPNTTPPGIFSLVVMPRLRLFKTNLPHKTIASFVDVH